MKRGSGGRAFFASPVGIAVIGIFSLVLIVNAYRVYILSKRLRTEHEELARQVQERERAIADLRAKIQALESGEGLEIEARSRLNLQKPDEKVLIVVDDANTQKQEPSFQNVSWFAHLKKWLGFGI